MASFFPFYRHTKRIWEVQCSCLGITEIKLPTSQKSLVYPAPSRWLFHSQQLTFLAGLRSLRARAEWQIPTVYVKSTLNKGVFDSQKLKGLKRCVLFRVWHLNQNCWKDNKGSSRQFGESCPASIKLENLIGSRARRISQFWLSFSGEQNQLSFTLSFGYVLFLPQLVFYLCFLKKI